MAAAATAAAVGDTVETATKRRVAAMGILTAPSSAAAGLDLTRQEHSPVFFLFLLFLGYISL